MRVSLGVFAAFCLLLCVPADAAQKRPSDGDRLQKLIEVSISGSPVVRPQAAERLTKMGGPARQAVLERLQQSLPSRDGETNLLGWFELGPDFLAMAARFTHTTSAQTQTSLEKGLRASLWKAAQDPDFPWRAAVVQGLGQPAQASEAERFLPFTDDLLPGVRIASWYGLKSWEPAKRKPVLRKALQGETDDRVRRAIAKFALEMGESAGAWVLLDELTCRATFFDQPIGRVARIEASQALAQFFPDAPSFDPSLPDGETAQAQWRALEAYLTEAVGPRQFPRHPWHSGGMKATLKGTPVLGLELRSCRTGEHFLRWTDADQLWVGRTEPVVFELAPGTVAGLLKTAQRTTQAMGKRYLTGEVGCDLETFYLPAQDEEKPRRYLVTKGPERVLGLRPEPLNDWVRLGLKNLPPGPASTSSAAVDSNGDATDRPDPRVVDLRKAIRSALLSVGGEWAAD